MAGKGKPGKRSSRGDKAGLPPGTPVYVGRKRTEHVAVTVYDYGPNRAERKQVRTISKVAPYRDTQTVTWINIDGIHDTQFIERLGTEFGVHPLILEDVANPTQRPKVEEHGEHIFIVLKMLRPDQTSETGVDAEQVSLILGNGYVISFQEKPGDVFDPVRQRILNDRGRIRKEGADYLAYALIDAVVDGYFQVLDHTDDRIEKLDEEVTAAERAGVLPEIHNMRRNLVFLRRCIWPLREAVNNLLRVPPPLVSDGTRVYLRDVYDHTLRVMDLLETFKERAASMIETYMTTISNRMNEVMKVLTLIATIFIPMTFVAGVYGMNFKRMPELDWSWGYPAAWALMLALGLGMLVYFRTRKWL